MQNVKVTNRTPIIVNMLRAWTIFPISEGIYIGYQDLDTRCIRFRFDTFTSIIYVSYSETRFHLIWRTGFVIPNNGKNLYPLYVTDVQWLWTHCIFTVRDWSSDCICSQCLKSKCEIFWVYCKKIHSVNLITCQNIKCFRCLVLEKNPRPFGEATLLAKDKFLDFVLGPNSLVCKI